jgi:dienelactone hydrolase
MKQFLAGLFTLLAVSARAADPLPGTQPLTLQGDLGAQMVAGVDKFLMRETERSVGERQKLWQRDFTSPEAYVKSVAPNREHLRKYVGAVDPRLPVTALEFISTTAGSDKVAETESYTIHAVRWPVFEGVYGEGLLLQPKGATLARIVALPDADQTPEMLAGLTPGIALESQFARILAENGCQVLIPVLIDRKDTWSGNAAVGRFTNQPHREWIYRQAFQMGRHIIGYEVQKVLAAVDWFVHENTTKAVKIGVAGYAEGGLIAFYSGALDPRIDVTLVSGYFNSRQRLWEEPIYRNVFAMLHEFGDAEIAGLIAPRQLIVEYSQTPVIEGPPKPRDGRSGAAPGKWATPEFNSVETEINRARGLFADKLPPTSLQFLHGNEGNALKAGSYKALQALTAGLGIKKDKLQISETLPADQRKAFSSEGRQQAQVRQLETHTQTVLRLSERVRDEFFWNKTKPTPTNDWVTGRKTYQSNLWEEVIGRFPAASLPGNARSRQIYDQPTWTGYEVVLDVWPDVYAWGYLLLPKDLKPGERRPVVVTQHGLEGVPEDTVNEDPKSRAYGPYKAFSTRLVEQGYIVFAPHNLYRGKDDFRVLQRKANPLKKSLFSVILAQHDRILDWLSEQPFVDPKRIGFYGLSYGGKTAMRVPSLLDRYCLSICSGDFNEWVNKCTTTENRYSYMFSGEYEMFEFNLGHTFNYAEMGALIAPRPFMVERGHYDGVGVDERVAYEYAKVRRFYGYLGIPQKTTIEFFMGPHTINGVGTYEFLRQHLEWRK